MASRVAGYSPTMSTNQAAELRARITATDPALLDVVDNLKSAFGASLKYIKLGEFELGNRKTYDAKGIVPSTAQVIGEGRALREAEQAFIAEALEARARTGGGPYRGKRKRVG